MLMTASPIMQIAAPASLFHVSVSWYISYPVNMSVTARNALWTMNPTLTSQPAL